VIVATNDTLLDPMHSYKLRSAFEENGVPVELARANGMPHGIAERHESDWPEGVNWWEEALEPGLAFAVKHMKA
jgi:acetyl esterase/lipase